jgi:AcrR family transcriptional regulator
VGDPARAQRKTQPERTDATRRKLIEAAISCLAEKGYADTSTTVVADRAGVSRGSIFYNYPTKADLMLAVIDHVYEQDTRLYDETLKDIADEREYALALTRLSWRAFSAPGGMAVMHIVLEGSRDPELKDRLAARLARVSERSEARLSARAPKGPARARLRTVAARVHVAALRGLAMELVTGGDPEDLADELALLSRYMEFVTDVLWPEAAAEDRKLRAARLADPRSDQPAS